MRIVLAAVMIALWAGAAAAQDNHVPRYGEEDKAKSPGEIESEKANSDAYRKSLGNIPDKGPTDPWGAVRSDGASKATIATAKPKKTRTGGAGVKPGACRSPSSAVRLSATARAPAGAARRSASGRAP